MTGSEWTLPPVLGEGRIGEAAEVLRRYFRSGVNGEPNFTAAATPRILESRRWEGVYGLR